MPALQLKDTVLVTGASGFLSAHVADQLVERGYHVIGTVRSESKGKYLEQLFAKRHGSRARFSYAIVEDIEAEGAFDQVIKDNKVDGIAHVASPFHFNVTDPYRDLVNPAVKGTKGLLHSAKKNGAHVKRVVITSSFAAMVNPPKQGQVFTEKDWNTHSLDELDAKGKDVSPIDAYRASKTLAEKAAWEFERDQKPGFDIATINPPYILGPIIHQCESAAKLNTSVAQYYAYQSGAKTEKDLETGGFQGCFVNVTDVAHAHVEALLRPQGTGRFAVSTRAFCWQEVVDELHQKYPDLQHVPKGKPGTGAEVNAKHFTIDSSHARKTLFDGRDFVSLQDTIKQMHDSLCEYEKQWSASH